MKNYQLYVNIFLWIPSWDNRIFHTILSNLCTLFDLECACIECGVDLECAIDLEMCNCGKYYQLYIDISVDRFLFQSCWNLPQKLQYGSNKKPLKYLYCMLISFSCKNNNFLINANFIIKDDIFMYGHICILMPWIDLSPLVINQKLKYLDIYKKNILFGKIS